LSRSARKNEQKRRCLAATRLDPEETGVDRRKHRVCMNLPRFMNIFTDTGRRAAVACLALAGVLTAHAQIPEKNPDRNPLATLKSLKCSFPVSAAGSWKDGVPQPPQARSEEISFDVDSIDAQEGSARLVAAEPVYITALLTASSIHFMERTLQGSLTVTTVFSLEGTQGKLRAVRSRHDYLKMSLPGYVSEPTVSQHYGECAPGR
jgi:hypothetical protein